MTHAATKRLRIVLLGTHGQRNIGDELLLETFLHQLGAEHSYVVNTYDLDYTRSQLGDRYDVELIHTTNDRRALLRALHTADRLVFAGGSIIKELNRRTTGRSPYATLLMLLAIVTYAKWVARIPRAMLNIGVGPIRTTRGRSLARAILAQVDLVTVRDVRSFELAKSAAPRLSHMSLVTDAVWADEPSWFVGATTTKGADDAALVPTAPDAPDEMGERVTRLALNLNSDLADAAVLERFTTTLQQAVREVGVTRPIELHLVPMQEGFKDDDDVETLDRFADSLGTINVIAHRPRDARDVAAILTHCDVLVAERLHAIVIASILGVPSLVLAYDVKVLALADQLALQHHLIDITQPFTVVQAADLINRTIDNRRELSEELLRRSATLHAEAEHNFATARRWLQAPRRTRSATEQ